MVENVKEYLDADELLHLALAANQQGKIEETISLLKRALVLTPKDGRLHYLLGAEHAQIGLYDRAIDEIRHAVELDPKLDTAHFQLGLLHLITDRLEAAAEAWKPLDKLNSEHFLYLFKTGLLHLAKNEFDESEQYIRRGITANKANMALNRDMERMLKDLQNRSVQSDRSSAPKAATSDTSAASNSKNVLLSAYKQNKTEE